MLTRRQRELFDFIVWFRAEHDYAPTLAEMATGVSGGLSNVHRMLSVLEAKGYVRRLRWRSGAVEIVDRSAPSQAMVKAGAEEVRALCGNIANAPEVARRVYSAMSLTG